jgi:hypothetical protein
VATPLRRAAAVHRQRLRVMEAALIVATIA